MGALLWQQYQRAGALEQQLTLSRQQVEELKAQNQGLTQQLASLQAERAGLDERVASLRAQLSSATADMERSRVTFGELEQRFASFSEERAKLQGQVVSLTVERDSAQRRVTELDEKKSELGQSVARLRERLALVERDYREVAEKLSSLEVAPHAGVNVLASIGPSSNGASAGGGTSGQAPANLYPGVVELPPIIVRKDQAGMSIPVRGRLVEVNESHDFIVVDKGTMDGVRVGMVFDIVRGASTIGRATVVRVRPQLSACDIVRQQTQGPLQVGDAAMQHGP